PIQLALYFWRIAHGDFGRSVTLSAPVLQLILSTLPATLELAISSIALAIATGIPLGLVAARARGTPLDTGTMLLAQLGVSMPVYWHALRNALLPIVTIVGLQFGNTLGGAVVTETIYGWPGMGRLVVQAIGQRDFPVVQGAVLALALLFSLVNMVVDLTYAFIDPRIRYE